MISWDLLIYFFVGMMMAALGIFDFKATQDDKPLKASSIGFVNDMTGDVVWAFILITPVGLVSREKALASFFCFNVGSFIGSWLSMIYHKKKRCMNKKT